MRKRDNRICQGDVFKDVIYIENIIPLGDDKFEISTIEFPLTIVLSQDCDLQWDSDIRVNQTTDEKGKKTPNDDKRLLSVIVAPIYNVEDAYEGIQLEGIGLKMSPLPRPENSKKQKSGTGQAIIQNKNSRYHYMEFSEDLQIVPSIIDFKHYFTVSVSYLESIRKINFICSIQDLYRESISQRFSNFLSRIGLPGNDG